MNIKRIGRVRAHMREQGLKQILVTAPASVRYLTGEWVHPGERMLALLVEEGGELLFTNRLFALDKSKHPLVEFDDTEDCVEVLARHISPGDLGIDKTWPSQFTIRLMEKRADVRPVMGSGPVDSARMIKDADELAALRESSRLNDLAVAALIKTLKTGCGELDAAREYYNIARALGADASFDPLICYGPNGASPHHSPGASALKPGDAVILDVGLSFMDGMSDITRTVFFGKATARQTEVYNIVKAANEAGCAAVKPGVPLRDIDRAARRVIEDAGFGPYFIHRTGHGIGIEVHEPPDVSASSPDTAAAGMVFSIEPGIYLAGEFGVRIEDLVAVTDDGCETLNSASRELTEIA
jgi:Xaa-Pro dipeptidase